MPPLQPGPRRQRRLRVANTTRRLTSLRRFMAAVLGLGAGVVCFAVTLSAGWQWSPAILIAAIAWYVVRAVIL